MDRHTTKTFVAPGLALCGLLTVLAGCSTPNTPQTPSRPGAMTWAPTECSYTAYDPNDPGEMAAVGGFRAPEFEGIDLNVCQQRACLSGLSINTVRETPWPEGRYSVIVTTEKGITECQLSLPDFDPPPCPERAAEPERSGASGEGAPLPDCRNPERIDDLGEIWFLSSPQKVAVKISFEGVTIAGQSFEPDYTTLRHDGYQCPDICRYSGPHNVTVTAP